SQYARSSFPLVIRGGIVTVAAHGGGRRENFDRAPAVMRYDVTWPSRKAMFIFFSWRFRSNHETSIALALFSNAAASVTGPTKTVRGDQTIHGSGIHEKAASLRSLASVISTTSVALRTFDMQPPRYRFSYLRS